MRSPLRIRRFALLAAALPLLWYPLAADAVPTGFVTVAGEGLVVDGVPWKAIGVNLWDMHAGKVLEGDITGCWYRHADLDDYFDRSFARIKANTNATVVRTFGFRSFYTDGGKDWSSTDKLLHYARKHGLRVIPVFGDQYATCGSPAKGASWYRQGYRTVIEQPWGIDYRSYVIKAVRRYKDDPTVAFWQLMNEATAGSDRDALASFSREMVEAIRGEGGDPHRPINLGTAGAGNELPAYANLLTCPASGGGGCNDLAAAHVFNATQPLPGLPLPSSVDAAIRVWNDAGEEYSAATTRPAIDGWSDVRITVPIPPSQVRYSRWAVTLSAPKAGAWSAYLDDAIVQTTTTPTLYTFEGGTEGFTATGATVSRTTAVARTGLASLHAGVPASASGSSVTITAPPISGNATSIEVHVRLNFRAPAPLAGRSIAANLHAAGVTRGAPFVLGEVGFQANVPGANCSSHMSRNQRAQALAEMLTTVLDPVYGADGALIWDWKDPSIRSTLADGTLVDDPQVDCWTVVPGDPAEAVLRSFATAVPSAPLPAPSPLPSMGPRMSVLRAPSGDVGVGEPVPITVRVTDGGNAMRGVRIVAGGGCEGWGTTDALGLADFTCVPTMLGTATFTAAPDPATCGCSLEPASFPVVVKRAVRLSASAEIAERHAPVRLRLSFTDPEGASLEGLRWRVPACDASGVIGGGGSSVTIQATCDTDWQGTKLLRLHVDSDASTAGASVDLVGVRFDRLYIDDRTRECVGLSSSSGWVGATARPGACSSAERGSFDDWFVHRVPEADRAAAFRPAAAATLVTVGAGEGKRIDGVFDTEGEARSFAAVVIRPDGAHLVASSA